MIKAPAKRRMLVVGRRNSKSNTLFVPVEVGNGLSLADRPQQWSRWCSQSIRAIDPNDKCKEVPSRLNTFENPLDEEKIARELNNFFAIPDDQSEIAEIAEKTRPHWMSNISYLDSAILGQVLFPTPISNTEKTSPKQPKDKGPRELITLVPGLVNSLENLGLDNLITKTWSEESLLIRLTPSPEKILSVPLEGIPDLEIRIFLDSTNQTTSIHEVRLVREKELDLLLPQNTTDLRFVRRSCVHSRKGGLDPSIEQFIQNSKLDIWGTGRLKTPCDLTLSIPPHALGPSHDSLTFRGFENENVRYTFASLEHRSKIGVPFHQPGSWADLTYTSIEAGKIGGRRDELVVTQQRRPKELVRETEDESENSDHQAPVQETVTDAEHVASLLSKANALIQRIENPPAPLTKDEQVGGGVGKAQAQFKKGKPRLGAKGRRLKVIKVKSAARVRKINT